MDKQPTPEQALSAGLLDDALHLLYGESGQLEGKRRVASTIAGFHEAFEQAPTALFSAPGRTELGGNHTDHQHGRVLAAAVNLDMLCAAAPNDCGTLRVQSEGYPRIEIGLDDLAPRQAERQSTAALVRGVAARFAALGHRLTGFDAYVTSNIPIGSGLSSSAATEVLLGTLCNAFSTGDDLAPVALAQIGQYAENVYFDKPCGLMDQTASAVGGVVAIDFLDPVHPIVAQIPLDLAATGHALCILDSGAGHADLTGEYAAITDELRAVCQCFDQQVLRDVPEETFMAAIPRVRERAGDRAVLRALHFYGENLRAAQQAQALKRGDFDAFLALVRASGRSSALYLQNITPLGQTQHQELMLALGLCERLLAGRGAVRVHGGGFGGTAQAFVPCDFLSEFQAHYEAAFGPGRCHVVSVRPVGSLQLVPEGGKQNG